MADDVIALVNLPPPPDLEGPALHAWVAQLKLRVHAREWIASKLRPKVYGASVDVNVQATAISITAALEQAHKRVRDFLDYEKLDSTNVPNLNINGD